MLERSGGKRQRNDSASRLHGLYA